MASTATATPLHETKPTIKTSYSTNRKGKKSEVKSEAGGAKRWKRRPDAIENLSCQAPAYDLVDTSGKHDSAMKNARKLWTRLKTHGSNSLVGNTKTKKGKSKLKKSKVVSPLKSSSSHKTIILSDNQTDLDSFQDINRFCEVNEIHSLDNHDTDYFEDYNECNSPNIIEEHIGNDSSGTDVKPLSATYIIEHISLPNSDAIKMCGDDITSDTEKHVNENGVLSSLLIKNSDCGGEQFCINEETVYSSLESDKEVSFNFPVAYSSDKNEGVELETSDHLTNDKESLGVDISIKENLYVATGCKESAGSDQSMKCNKLSNYVSKLRKSSDEKLSNQPEVCLTSNKKTGSKSNNPGDLFDEDLANTSHTTRSLSPKHILCLKPKGNKKNKKAEGHFPTNIDKKKSSWDICLNRNKVKNSAFCECKDIITVIKNQLDLLSRSKCFVHNNTSVSEPIRIINECDERDHFKSSKRVKNPLLFFSCSDTEIYKRESLINECNSFAKIRDVQSLMSANSCSLNRKNITNTSTKTISTQTCITKLLKNTMNFEDNDFVCSYRDDSRNRGVLEKCINVNSPHRLDMIKGESTRSKHIGTFGMDSRLKDVRRLLNRNNLERRSNDSSFDYLEDDCSTNCGSLNGRNSDTEETVFIQSMDQTGSDCDVVLTSVKRLSNPRENLNRRIALKEWRLTQSGFSASSTGEPWLHFDQNEINQVRRIGGAGDVGSGFIGSAHLPPLGNSTPKRLNRRWSPSGTEQTNTVGNTQDDPALSKFCHECGGRYPVPGAKFCCLCGVRRLAI